MSKKDMKNYIKLGVILIFTILIAVVISNLYRSYDNNKANKSYISKHVTSLQCKDLSNALLELSGKNYIYISYTGNKNIYEMEKRLKRILKQNDLEDNFIYVDCSSELSTGNHVKSLVDILAVGERELTLPTIVYFNDVTPTDFIDSQNGLIDATDFSKLLDQYEVNNN